MLALAILSSPWWLLTLGAGGIVYLWTPYRRLLPDLGNMALVKQLRALALVPIIRIVGDVAKMCGYPVGLAWRLRRRDDSALYWRKALDRRSEAP